LVFIFLLQARYSDQLKGVPKTRRKTRHTVIHKKAQKIKRKERKELSLFRFLSCNLATNQNVARIAEIAAIKANTMASLISGDRLFEE
jgi:hypothetical protein